MTIQLENLVPVPLKEKILARGSQVWNTQLTLQPGERIKIKAPSGTGKTTLTHYIYHMRYDYTGTVAYDGTATKTMQVEALAKVRQQKMSVILQDLRLFEHLSAFENIELKRVMIEKPYHESQRIHEMAALLGITHILQQPARICSYGEQQRIAIIRALMQPFEWLVMDEPFSHLDNDNTQKAAALIEEECNKRKAGFVLTDLDEDHHFQYTRHLAL
jgi:ABC-type lipoprotein export system ATPase subunit